MTNTTRLLGYMKEVRIADMDTLKTIFPNVSQILNTLIKKGEIVRIKRGYYAYYPFDPFEVSRYLSYGYISFFSALYYYKAVTEIPTTIYIATKNISRSMRIKDVEFKEVALKKRFCGYVDKDSIRIATKAKAIYDSLRKPELSGGFGKVLFAINEMKLNTEEWKEFLNYVKKFERPGFCQRIGYLLSLIDTPSFILKELKNLSGRSKVYLYGRSSGKLVNEWNVVDNIGKEVLLSWMKG